MSFTQAKRSAFTEALQKSTGKAKELPQRPDVAAALEPPKQTARSAFSDALAKAYVTNESEQRVADEEAEARKAAQRCGCF